MPWENNSPLTRLTCLPRSAISTLRSRQRRRRSSSSTEFQRDKTGGKMSLDSGRRFGAVRYAWHGRLLSDWSQPHSARALVAILLPMGSINSGQRSETADGAARESENSDMNGMAQGLEHAF